MEETMKVFRVLGIAFLLSGSVFAADLNLSCEVIGGNRCDGDAAKDKSVACYEDITLKKLGEEPAELSFRLQPVFQEIYRLPTVVKQDSEEDSFNSKYVAKEFAGISFAMGEGENWGELMQVLTGDYVGHITLEEDFGMVVHCKSAKK
jgi:hypothetical protein